MRENSKIVLWIVVGLSAARPAQLHAQMPTSAPSGSSRGGLPSAPRADERPVSWKRFFPNVLDDQKRLWLFPKSLAQGKHWAPTAALVLGTGALVALDPHDTPYFRSTQSFAGFNRSFSSLNTSLGERLFPVAFFLVGHARHDSCSETTALLAGEAQVDALILSEVMKNVGRRLRPREIPPGGDFTHTWFKADGGIFSSRGSFPSGHAIAAFSIATVFARRYPNHRWVPWVAYGLAGLVGFSRVTLSEHFPSDVFAGAALGYAITRYDVLRQP